MLPNLNNVFFKLQDMGHMWMPHISFTQLGLKNLILASKHEGDYISPLPTSGFRVYLKSK
jgi:hypothetical protein